MNKFTELIKGKLAEADVLLEETNNIRIKLEKQLLEIREKDQKGEKPNELVVDYMKDGSKTFILNEDLKRIFSELACLYRTSKLMEVELDLTDSEKNRLNYTEKNEVSHFIVVKGNLIPRDEAMDSRIEQGIKDKGNRAVDKFLESLRKLDTNEDS